MNFWMTLHDWKRNLMSLDEDWYMFLRSSLSDDFTLVFAGIDLVNYIACLHVFTSQKNQQLCRASYVTISYNSIHTFLVGCEKSRFHV